MNTTPARLLTAILFVAAAPCQDDPKPLTVTIATVSGDFMLEPGTHEIPALVDGVAEFLDYNILYNEAELTPMGQIRTTRRTVVDKQGCWDLLGALLYHKGLAILPLDRAAGFYEVIAMSGPRSQEVTDAALFVPHDEVESYANQKATPIVTSVPLRNINATVATNALRPFFASGRRNAGLTLGNVGNNTDILLQGFAPQVATACRLLKLVDVGDDTNRSEIVVVALEHADSNDIVARIDEVLGPRAAQAQAQMQGGVMVGMPLRAVAHPELNAVILSGSAGQLRDAAALIDTLDVQGRGLPAIVVVRLQHAEPGDIAARIAAIFAPHPAPQQMRAGHVVPPVRAVPHAALAAVILSGNAEQIRSAHNLIAKLDTPMTDGEGEVPEDLGRRLQRLEQQIERLTRALRSAK